MQLAECQSPYHAKEFGVLIRFFVLSMLVIAVPFSAVAQGSTVSELTVGSFSVKPDSVRNFPTIQVDLVLVIESGNARHYRVDSVVTDWQGSAKAFSADSLTCPAIIQQMAKVEHLPMPSFIAPDSAKGQNAPIMLHPTTYTLAMRGNEGVSGTGARIEISAESGSPLAQWTEETLKAIEPCWRNRGN